MPWEQMITYTWGGVTLWLLFKIAGLLIINNDLLRGEDED